MVIGSSLFSRLSKFLFTFSQTLLHLAVEDLLGREVKQRAVKTLGVIALDKASNLSSCIVHIQEALLPEAFLGERAMIPFDLPLLCG